MAHSDRPFPLLLHHYWLHLPDIACFHALPTLFCGVYLLQCWTPSACPVVTLLRIAWRPTAFLHRASTQRGHVFSRTNPMCSWIGIPQLHGHNLFGRG
eukprot:5256842-Lingulodinium_polyedra.AAC.1